MTAPQDPYSHYASELAKQCAESTDGAIKDALAKHSVTFVDYVALASHMHREIDQCDQTETYFYDGKPIIKFWPLEVKTVNEDHSVKIVATRKFIT